VGNCGPACIFVCQAPGAQHWASKVVLLVQGSVQRLECQLLFQLDKSPCRKESVFWFVMCHHDLLGNMVHAFLAKVQF